MKKAIVIGSGAGGATAAKELQGIYDVTILEAGAEFRPFSMSLSKIDKAKTLGLLFDEREIALLFPTMKIRKTPDRMILVNGIGLGGTTTLATGNALRVDKDLLDLGICLDSEFEELKSEIPIHTRHRQHWRDTTNRLFDICTDMNLNPIPLPKMGYAERCTNCGRCILGCPNGSKWDTRQYIAQALEKGAHLITGCRVEKIYISGGEATGVLAKTGRRSQVYQADLIIIAAGGFATPVILENSGISCENTLFVDPVLCIAAEWRGAFQNKEICMPFAFQRDHYIVAPYFDYFSYFFDIKWKYGLNNIYSLMIKLADTNLGYISSKKIEKSLTDEDKINLEDAVELCTELFGRLGVARDSLFLGKLNAGHPGGMLPLTNNEANTLHNSRLPSNLYVADSSLFPRSLGNPPILTIMALAKRISKLCVAQV
jgi:choline dehydrogenase-like flavoprotein